MSVYLNPKSPFWQFDFRLHGHRFCGATPVARDKDKRHAEAFEAEERQRAQKFTAELAESGSKPLTLGPACARWWDEHGRHGNDPDLAARLDWIVARLGAQTPLHAITDDMVSKLVEARRRDVRRAGRDQDGTQLYRPITARTVNKTTVSLLRRVIRRARDNWGATILREPKWQKHWLKETRRPVRELTAAEDTALDAVEDADYRALRRFAEITGLRRRNLLLTWPQVDFEQAVLRIVTKGGVPRILPLTREAYAILWARRGQHPVFVFTFVAQRTRRCPKTFGADGQPFLFVRGMRYPITYYGMGSNQRKWSKAGVDARIHDLRHTAGSRTLRRTGNLKLVQLMLGHSDIKTTSTFYANVTLDDIRAGMESASETTPAAAVREVKGGGE